LYVNVFGEIEPEVSIASIDAEKIELEYPLA
jgi:hypothetical protein